MKAKEKYEMLKGIYPNKTQEDFIQETVYTLLDALYIPSQENLRTLDRDRLIKFNINFDEPVNWGGLGVSEVRVFRELIEIILDEASPNSCPTLCEYIEKYLGFQGYSNILVRTEW